MKIRLLYLVLVGVIAATWGVYGVQVRKIQADAEQYNKKAYETMMANLTKGSQSKDYTYLMNRGYAFLKDGRTDLAIMELQAAVNLDVNFKEGPKLLGYAYLKKIATSDKENWFGVKDELSRAEEQEHLSKAKEKLELAYKIDPLDEMTSKLLSIAAEKSGDDKDQELWYARYKEVSKGF